MQGNLWRWVVGLLLLLALVVGAVVLVEAVIIPLVHTAILPHISPFMGPICPGNPECG